MNVHVLLNLLNELGKKIRWEAYWFSQMNLITSMIQEHEFKIIFIIWHQNRILLANFALKRHYFAIRKRNLLMDVNA